MFENINLQYPSWYIILCAVLAITFSAILYYKDKRFQDFSKAVSIGLSALRFLSIFGITLLLLNPLIKRFTQEKKKPIIIIAEDVSKSISFKNLDTKKINHEALNNISHQLSEKYDVKHLSFGDHVSPYVQDSTMESSSNLSNVFQYISNNYGSDHVGAIILSTDGIYNEGYNPIYTSTNLSVPIYTIALGDTTHSKDLLIKNIYHNKIAYLNNEFIAQLDIQAFNAKGQSSTVEVYKISKQSARKKIFEKRITINKDNFFQTIDLKLKADTKGLNQYRVVLKAIKNELTYENNLKDIYIDALDLQQKVLIFAAAPHPDISAIRTILSENENYKIEVQHIRDKLKKKLNSYDLVVFHNLPITGYDLKNELSILNDHKTPRLFIIGSDVNFNQFNKVQDCIKIKITGRSISEIQADVNSNFRPFIFDNDFKKMIHKFPPLVNGFGDYELLPGSNVLLNQKISKIKTKYPLLAYKDIQGIKTGVLAGEGIWKWKLYEYLESNSTEVLNDLLRKTFQYLTVKNDKRKLRVDSNKKLYKENESIYFNGQVFNDNYELINEPELNIEVRDNDGNKYDFVFSRIEDFYTLNANQLPAGNYHYKATCLLNGTSLEAKSRFLVKKSQMELYDLTARHNILKQLSNQSNGKMYSLENSQSIASDIQANTSIKPLIFQHEKSESIINYKLILALLILLLIVEWFIRRYLGSY